MAKKWVAERFGGLDGLRLIESDVPEPGPGEVTIRVKAAGMNPADYKHLAGGDPSLLPLPIGYEVAGTIIAVGPGDSVGGEGGAVGGDVLAFRVSGGYASELTVPARDVFAKPENLSFPEAANLLLAGATAAEMLHVTGVTAGETILVHGASGAVGASVLQQARELGVHVVGTASARNFDIVRRYGGEPVEYGEGLQQRVRELLPNGAAAAALDCVGTDEAVDVSLAVVADHSRVVTIAAAAQRAERDGILAIAGRMPASAAFRDQVRPRLVRMAAEGRLEVPIARTFPLEDAVEALTLLESGHPGGKLALIPVVE